MPSLIIDTGAGGGDVVPGVFVVVATIPAVPADVPSKSYRLHIELSNLDQGHDLSVREATESDPGGTVTDVGGSGGTTFVIDVSRAGAGMEETTVSISDDTVASNGATWTWTLYDDSLQQPADDGRYVKRSLLLAAGGQESFDAEFRLDPLAITADEAAVADIIRLGDNMVEAIAYKVGLNKLDGGPGDAGWAIAVADEPVFTECSLWASRWGRAMAHAMQPESNAEAGDRDDVEGTPPDAQAGQPEAGFVGARREAERKIKEILTAKYKRQQLAVITNTPSTTDDIIAVGWNDACGPLPTSIDPRTIAR
jgi:hypothetical protein